MRPTNLWTKVLAQTLSFALLTQTATPAFAFHRKHNHLPPPETGDRLFFGPKVYTRGGGKQTKFYNLVPVPKDLKAPFKIRVRATTPVEAKIKINGLVAMTGAEFKLTDPTVKDISSRRQWIILEVLMEGLKGERFKLELFGREKNAPPPLPVPPQISIVAPTADTWVGSTTTAQVAFQTPGGLSGLTTILDSTPVTLAVSSNTAQGPLTLATEGTHQLTATVKDNASQSATANVTFKADLTPPTLTVDWPAEGAVVRTSSASFAGAVSDLLSGVSTVTCGGIPATVLYGRWACDVLLAPGLSTMTINAQDMVGNTAQMNRTITYQPNRPPTAHAGGPYAGEQGTTINFDGTASSDPDGDPLTYSWNFGGGDTATGATATHVFTSSGTYPVTLQVSDGKLTIEAMAMATITHTPPPPPPPPPDPTLPPDPATVAPPLDLTVATSMAASTEFLYTGDKPIQVGVSSGTINPAHVAVLRGKIINREGAALPGATVTILAHPEYGSTKSRADGMFDMAVNGGGAITLTYEKDGYLTVQRQVIAPWQDWAVVDDAVMIPLDPKVTKVDLTAPTIQVAQGPVVTDDSGPRQATMIFPAGTTAEKVNPDGTTEPLTTMNVRATEYTVGPKGPQSMPGELPPTSGYTYAVELSADEALDAKTVKFSKPMSFYVDNFLHFPVGGIVPVGYYDRERGVWVPSENGKIVKILAPSGDLANLDTNGNGTPATPAILSALGVTDDERRELAKLYTPGQSLWRVPITHMTPWDCNWPYGPPKDAKGPNPDEDPSKDGREDDSCKESGGSVIECENQTVSESVPITGTPFTLNYISDRVPGHEAFRALKIPISGSDMPAGVKRMDVNITVAGVTSRRSFTPEPNKRDVFKWDGKDAFGRAVSGSQKAEVSIQYTYNATYREPADIRSSFGLAGGTEITSDSTRAEVTLGRKSTVDLESWNGKNEGLGGWTLNTHHTYRSTDMGILHGDGSRRSITGILNVITTFAGKGLYGFSGDGGPAATAQLANPSGIAVDSKGNLFIADTSNTRIRKVDVKGNIITTAGNGETIYMGDGIPAVEASIGYPYDVAVDRLGNLFIADTFNKRIRKVSTDGIISTVAGKFGYDYDSTGDGGPATLASLNYPISVAVDLAGNLFIGEANGHRVRMVTAEGIISTVAGNGETGFSGDGGPARNASLSVGDVTVDALGNLFIADSVNHRIRKVSIDGTISTVAGNGEKGFSGDGGLAKSAALSDPSGVAVDALGNLYVADTGNNRIRMVAIDGKINTVVGNGVPGFSGDGGLAAVAQLSRPMGVAVDSMGNLYVSDSGNNRIRMVKPGSAGLVSDEFHVPSENGLELYIFDQKGRHLRTVTAKTRSLIQQFAYNVRGDLISATDGDGNLTTIERDDAGKPKAIIAPHGQRTELTLDANGWLAQITDPAGGTHKAKYLENGLMYSFTDPNNNSSAMEYDDLGRLIYDKNAAGKLWTVARGELTKGKEIGMTTGLGRTLKYKVQDLPTGDHLRTNTTADGRVTKSLRKTDGTTIVTSPTGVISSVKKSPDPRLKMAAPLNSRKQAMPSGLTRETNVTRTVSLSNPDDPLRLTAETTTVTMNGQIYTTVFSSATRTISSFTPTGRKNMALLDARGRISQSKTGTLAPASYAYDAKGRLSELTQGSGAESRSAQFTYGTDGFLSKVTDALGRHVNFEHDVLGRVTKQTLPDGRETRTSYDANGNVLSITPPGRPAHVYTYDAGNQVSGYTAPDVGAGPTATTYAYDLEGHPTLITRPDGQTLTFDYNAGGQLSTVTTPSGIINYTYDSGGRLSNLNENATGINLTYAYDGTLPLSTTWTGPITGDVSRTYDNNFRVVTQSVNGANTVNFTYDNDGLLTKAGDLDLTRDADNGLLSATSIGVIADAWTYNTFGEPTNYTATKSGADAYSATFTRDALGRITTKNETIGAESHNYVYTYDESGRLTTVQKDATPTTYTYDPNGNRLKHVAGGITTTGAYDAQDRLLTYGGNTYTYTTNGELKSKTNTSGTTTYTYDVAGNLRNAVMPDGKAIEYLIDGQNRRTAKKVNGTLTQGFLYNTQLQIVAELDGTGAVVSRFVYADRANVPSYMVKGGTTYRIISDHLGSPRLVVNTADGSVAQKLDYDEFGNVLTDTSPGFTPFAFAGGLYDQDTKLVRFGARDYDPEVSRWTATDPIQFRGGDPNLYGYVLNDPINLIDPTGFDYTEDGIIYDDNGSMIGELGLQSPNPAQDPVLLISFGAVLGAKSLAEMLEVEYNIFSEGNICKLVSKKLKRGFRIDPAHHGKSWGHFHFWKW